MWSRQGKDLTAQFPDVAAAAVAQLPDGCVVDGELVALDPDGRLSFDLLQVAKGFSASCPSGKVSVPVTGLVQMWSANPPPRRVGWR